MRIARFLKAIRRFFLFYRHATRLFYRGKFIWRFCLIPRLHEPEREQFIWPIVITFKYHLCQLFSIIIHAVVISLLMLFSLYILGQQNSRRVTAGAD